MNKTKVDDRELERLKKALREAKIDELLVDKFAIGALMACGEACYSGCAACCSSGTANRRAQVL